MRALHDGLFFIFSSLSRSSRSTGFTRLLHFLSINMASNHPKFRLKKALFFASPLWTPKPRGRRLLLFASPPSPTQGSFRVLVPPNRSSVGSVSATKGDDDTTRKRRESWEIFFSKEAFIFRVLQTLRRSKWRSLFTFVKALVG